MLFWVPSIFSSLYYIICLCTALSVCVCVREREQERERAFIQRYPPERDLPQMTCECTSLFLSCITPSLSLFLLLAVSHSLLSSCEPTFSSIILSLNSLLKLCLCRQRSGKMPLFHFSPIFFPISFPISLLFSLHLFSNVHLFASFSCFITQHLSDSTCCKFQMF